eukprot:scpid33445/ scgid30594/ 
MCFCMRSVGRMSYASVRQDSAFESSPSLAYFLPSLTSRLKMTRSSSEMAVSPAPLGPADLIASFIVLRPDFNSSSPPISLYNPPQRLYTRPGCAAYKTSRYNYKVFQVVVTTNFVRNFIHNRSIRLQLQLPLLHRSPIPNTM